MSSPSVADRITQSPEICKTKAHQLKLYPSELTIGNNSRTLMSAWKSCIYVVVFLEGSAVTVS